MFSGSLYLAAVDAMMYRPTRDPLSTFILLTLIKVNSKREGKRIRELESERVSEGEGEKMREDEVRLEEK